MPSWKEYVAASGGDLKAASEAYKAQADITSPSAPSAGPSSGGALFDDVDTTKERESLMIPAKKTEADDTEGW